MRKYIKRTVAAVLALTITASGIGYTTANAASQSVSWNARCVNVPGAPTSESKNGYATLHATSEKYTGKVTSMSDIANRKLKLSCTTHSMSTGTLEYNNTGSRTWTISGSVSKVTYKMVASTSLKTVLSVNGVIKR